MMVDFLEFLLKRVYNSKPISEAIVLSAFEKTILDIQYHFTDMTKEEIVGTIETNSNELAVFLYRLGNTLYELNEDYLLPQIHWLLKELCSCELYFNNNIGEGFYVVHGEGTVIGSRNIIGKGFKIHQGCTIGHKKNNTGNGVVIGNNVTLYSNSSILGDITIGDNVIIGAHVLIRKSVPQNKMIFAKENFQTKNFIK